MSSGSGIKYDVARLLIAADLAFCRRFLERVVADTGKAVIPIFCLNNYLSLIIHESYRTLKVTDPEFAAALVYEHEETIRRARLSVKFFDDSKTSGLDSVGDAFARIIDEGRQAFLGRTWFPPARRWETDLGEYRYRGRLVSTTHTVGFVMALRVDALKDLPALGQELSAVAQAQSAYVSRAAGNLSWSGPSFMNSITDDAFEARDRQSERHFARIFDAGLPEKMKASLTAFQCSLNVLDVMLQDDSPASAETVFKLRYVTLYHVLSSLEKLRDQYQKALGTESRSLLAAMLDHPVSVEIRSGEARHFRNTLIHYTPAEHLVSKLSIKAPYYGLVEACFPTRDFPSLRTAVAEHTGRMAALMDRWSGG
ncbi:hypothetical protein [Kitasatospora sp. NPDC004531]